MKHYRKGLPWGVLGLAVAAAAAFPAVAGAQSEGTLEERVARVERMLNTETLVKLLQTVEKLEGEVRELRGELEVQGHTLTQMKNRQRELYLDVDRRLQRVEARGTAPASAAAAAAAPASGGPAAATPPGGASAPSAPAGAATTPPAGGQATVASAAPAASAAPEAGADPIEVQQAYQSAFNLLKSGRYDQATKGFREFLAEHPQSKYSDNAQYWLGETYYVTRKFDDAMREFEKLVAEHPESAKLTHALLKIGYIHDELGRDDEAQRVLTDLSERFPQSTAAGLARKRLERMRGQ